MMDFATRKGMDALQRTIERQRALERLNPDRNFVAWLIFIGESFGLPPEMMRYDDTRLPIIWPDE